MRILHVGWGFSTWRPGGLIAYAEDLMAAQCSRGDDVSYFFSGRHYPYLSGPRLKRWRRRRVKMYEVINSPLLAGLEHGTRDPAGELSEPRIEAAFRHVMERERPEIVHFQELHALPSSLIDISAAGGVPTVMTLQDYGPLCATLRLFDSDGRRCMRRDVGADCVRRNAQAPTDARTLVVVTLRFEAERVGRFLPVASIVDSRRLASVFVPLKDRILKDTWAAAQTDASTEVETSTDEGKAGEETLAREFQRRRNVNVERLGRVGKLIAQSQRVAEIYGTLGVPVDRMTTLPFTLSHIAHLRPRSLSTEPQTVTFVTLNGCASASKGSRLILAAMRALAREEVGGFRLRVLGHVEREIAAELDGFAEVELHGTYEPDQLDSLLDDCDVGLVPSLWEEALGYTGLELIAKGIPLIANPLGGLVEYARPEETAWLNESCSPEGLARLMAELVSDPARVVEMHHRVLDARKRLVIPLSAHVDAIYDVYEKLAGERVS